MEGVGFGAALGGFKSWGSLGFWGFKAQASRICTLGFKVHILDSGLGAVQGRTVSMHGSMLCLPSGPVEILWDPGL